MNKCKLHCGDMEVALARHFNWRVNLIVPNVSWGFDLKYEADLLVVSPAGYVTEIEIKVSRGDIKADLKKHKCAHRSKLVKRFFYAVPQSIADSEWLPLDCGLITVNDNFTYDVKVVRPPRINREAKPLEDHKIRELMSLGCMRIWSLKEALNNKTRKWANNG